jgi:hypothetical protein
MATQTETQRGFAHRCPFCGEEDTLRVDLGDTSNLLCSSCDSQITIDDIQTVISQWRVILSWLKTAPEREDA